ncbi:MAG: hypothetical protein Q8K99_05775 [Actinomycetota bacterium]|nr:hypothetical protein [Actinomycetota bacterium]
MKRARTTTVLVAILMAIPAPAYAAEPAFEIVPHWLSIIVGLVGLGISLILLLNAYALRSVADGSMVADNIVYMMLAVVCFAASMIARWVGVFTTDVNLAVQVSLAGDLLVTAALALLGVYFYRIRAAMTQYLKAAKDMAKAAGSVPSEGGNDG